MKVCFITPLFEPWNIGGAEKYINTLSNEVSKLHNVIVITSQGPEPRKSNQRNPSLKIIELKNKNKTSLYSIYKNQSKLNFRKKLIWNLSDFWNLNYFLQIKKILVNEKPDIIHTNGITGLSSSVFSAITKTKIPHVHTLHDYELISRWSSLFRKGKPIEHFNLLDKTYIHFMRKISSNISSVISPSQFLMNSHTQLGYFKNSSKHVIPHGMILKNDINPKRGDGREFIFLGRVTMQKGVHKAVEVIKNIKEKNIKFHIVGEGPNLDYVKRTSLNDSRIIFHGYVDNKKLEQLLQNCSYAIVPSLSYEPFGLVINELMNMGLPVLGSNRGAIPELVKNGNNGFIFNPDNPKELHDIINSLIANEEKLYNLSQNAIFSSNGFPLDRQIKMTLDVYSDLI